MKALVINLESATERMTFQIQQLNSLKIPFQRLAAYEIDNVHNIIYQRNYKTWQRPMSISEVSCFFSHKNAWDLIIKENQAMLILEDDALLSQNLPNILEEISILKNIDYINLEERKKRKKLLANSSIQEFCNSNLIRLYQGRSGAAAYILWPSGAKKLLQQMNNKGIGIADKFINENYLLNAYQLEPAPVIQLDQCKLYGLESPFDVNSSINKKTSDNNFQWHFKIRRIIGQLKIGINYLRHFHHATRRKVEISNQF